MDSSPYVVAAMNAIFFATASCRADRQAPLNAFGRPFAGDAEAPLAGRDAHRR